MVSSMKTVVRVKENEIKKLNPLLVQSQIWSQACAGSVVIWIQENDATGSDCTDQFAVQIQSAFISDSILPPPPLCNSGGRKISDPPPEIWTPEQTLDSIRPHLPHIRTGFRIRKKQSSVIEFHPLYFIISSFHHLQPQNISSSIFHHFILYILQPQLLFETPTQSSGELWITMASTVHQGSL